MTKTIKYLCIIQARFPGAANSRFPGKVMEMVGGKTMLRRVWDAAKGCSVIDKVIVAWPERYPDLDENDVLGRFQRICREFPSEFVIRLTADCPLLTTLDICEALDQVNSNSNYYSNRRDGHDVQIVRTSFLFTDRHTHKEHVILDGFPTPDTGLSVNNRGQLQRVRRIVSYAK